MRVDKSKLIIAMLMIAIYFLLDICYTYTIQGIYNRYAQFWVGEVSQRIYTLTFILPISLTLLLVVLPSTELIVCLLSLVLVLVIYPSSILTRNLNSDLRVFLLNHLYFFGIYFSSVFFKARLKVTNIKKNQKTTILLVVSIAMLIPFLIIYGGSIDFSNLLLNNIDSSRILQKELANKYTGYAYSPLTNVLIPLLLLFSIMYRQYYRAFAAFLMLIFMFLVGGHKSVFFGAILLVFFYYGSYVQKMKWFYLGTSAILLASVITFIALNNLFLTSLITERIFFLPALLDIAYFNYFDQTPIFYSQSFLSAFVDYPFDLAPPYAIGHYAMGNSLTHANTGIISDGFMNMGILGAIINIFMASFLFAIINTLNISHRFFGLPFLLFTIFASSYFFAALITHGGLLLILAAHFFLKDTESDESNSKVLD